MNLTCMLYSVDPKEKIATITFNRPEKLNAMPFVSDGELAQCIDAAERDDQVKVVILKGAGRAFCAGHDLNEWLPAFGFEGKKAIKEAAKKQKPSQRERLLTNRDNRAARRRLLFSWKPTIAQVHGYCFQWGMHIQLLCDMTFAAQDAQFGYLGHRIGLSGVDMIRYLTLLVGPKKATELMLRGVKLSGREAEEIGLINKAVPAGELEAEVLKVAREIALLPLDGIVVGKAYKQMVFESMGLSATFAETAIGHNLITSLRFEPDEFQFFKTLRDKGLRDAVRARDSRYERISS